MPSDRVKQLLEVNAQNWAYTTQLILQEHYQQLIKQTRQEFKACTDKADCDSNKPGHKELCKRIESDVVERVEALLAAEIDGEHEQGYNENKAQSAQQTQSN